MREGSTALARKYGSSESVGTVVMAEVEIKRWGRVDFWSGLLFQ